MSFHFRICNIKRVGWCGYLGWRKVAHFASEEMARDWYRRMHGVRSNNMAKVQAEVFVQDSQGSL